MKKSLYIALFSVAFLMSIFTGSTILSYAQDTADISVQNVSGLSVSSNSTKSISLTWNDVDNANGYEVYTLSSDTYTLVGDTEVSSYTSSSLTSGTAYDFSVRAYTYNESGEKIYSAYSNALSCATNPTKVKIASLETPSTSSVKIKWSKVDCTGYQIEYATDKKFKKNEKTIRIKSKSTLNKTISKLKTGKTYYLRVRAYVKCGGKYYYGEWSSYDNQKIYSSKNIITGTTLMESASWSSDSLATIKSGASVRVIGSSARWYKVIYNNKTGYVYNLAFKKSGSSNLSRTKVTTSNYTTYLDDVLFNIGKSQKAIYDYVCKNMSYSYAKISTQQKKANISSLSSVNKNTALLTTVAITKKGGICYNYAALTKALYERAGYDAQCVVGKGKYGAHCWVIVKTSNGYRHIDTVRKAYSYTDKQFSSSSKTGDLSWSKSTYPKCV